MWLERMQEEEGASTGGLLASVRERTDTGDGVRQYPEVIVEEERVRTSPKYVGGLPHGSRWGCNQEAT